MKIWVDDVRPAPKGWVWCKTSADTIRLLTNVKIQSEKLGINDGSQIETMSLDHDLGFVTYMQRDDTTRPVVLWMCENEWWPDIVVVHSANPVGIEWLEGMIRRYKI